MSRKRSIASILNEESELTSSQLLTSRLSRSAYSFINDETEELTLNQQLSTQPYNKVICNCAKCKGKLVELHTKIAYKIDQHSDDKLEESSFGAKFWPLPSFGNTSAEFQLTEESEIEELVIEEPETRSPEEENDNDETSASTDNDKPEFIFLSQQHLRMYKI